MKCEGTRAAYFPEAGSFVPTTVYDRYRLRAGDELSGPAVVEEEGSTLVVGPGGRARIAASGNIVVTLGAPDPLPVPEHPPVVVMATDKPEEAVAATPKLARLFALAGACVVTVMLWAAFCAVVLLVTSGAAV